MCVKMEERNEKISVIMGIFNCAGTLPDAVESIINQTYTNWQLVMCDDGSTDETYATAKKYADLYPDKIILLKNDRNMKLSYSLNRCLEHATGFYVARMDGDDISAAKRFEKQVAFLKLHPQYSLVGTAMRRFSDKGQADIQFGAKAPDRYTLRNTVPFNHATIMTYKSVYDELDGYLVSARTERSQDYDLWFRFYAKGYEGNNLTEPLYFVREDINSIKRRTFRGRIKTYKTTLVGFKMLSYPLRWYIRPTLSLLKGLVPSGLILVYRRFQAKRHKTNRQEGEIC